MPPFSQQDETIRVNAAAVQLDVIVTDQAGRRINGLTAADCQIPDEGKSANIDFFTAIEKSRVSRTEKGAASDSSGGDSKTSPALVTLLVTVSRGGTWRWSSMK